MIDKGSAISESDYKKIGLFRSFIYLHLQYLMCLIALKHTSKLQSFSDSTSIRTFGFCGEALSLLCAMNEQVTVTTTTSPLGVSLDMDSHGAPRKLQNPRQNLRGHLVGYARTGSDLYCPREVASVRRGGGKGGGCGSALV